MNASSRFTVRPAAESDRPAWEGLLSRAPQALPLHHWDWPGLAAVERGRPVRLLVCATDGTPVAAVSLVERRIRGLRHWRHPAPCPSGGLLLAQDDAPALQRDVLQALSSYCRRAVPCCELIFSPHVPDLRPLLWEGWSASPHYNYVSRIDAEDALARDAENAVRRQAAKAAAEGLQLHEGPQWIEPVLALAEETRRRQGIPPWVAPEFFRRLVNGAEDDGLGTIVLAVTGRDEHEPHAGAVLLHWRGTVTYLLGASRLDAGAPRGAPTLLHMEGTAACFRRWGCLDYDWAGANTAGVAQFKKKFRPRLIMGMRVVHRRGAARLLAR